MAAWDRLRDELAGKLTSLYETQAERGLSPLTETELAHRLSAAHATSWSQSKVSRVRRGKTVPTPEDGRHLALAMGADETTARQIEALVQRIDDERPAVSSSWGILQQGGSANFQRKIARIEAQAAEQRTYHPAVVDGLLQTEPVMRAIAHSAATRPSEDPDLKDWLAARRERQAAALAADRPVTLIVPETALWGASGTLVGPEEMAEQADHIAKVSRDHEGAWKIGVIPRGRPPRGRALYMLHGFAVYLNADGQGTGVLFGTHSGTALLTADREIAKYLTLFERLADLAEWGESGRQVLSRVAREYRETRYESR